MRVSRSTRGQSHMAFLTVFHIIFFFYFQPSCENDPKAQRPTLSKSNTVQDLSPCRGPAPGHGFPLIKRKVQQLDLKQTQRPQNLILSHF